MTRGLYSGENVILVTGLPGRGKTLLALWLVSRIAEGRPVYVAGVRGLKPRDGWQELEDRTKWHECPPGSVVLIDEGQEAFRPSGTGAAVPEHIAKMERVRHTGITLVITTQHPMLIHGNVRKLTQAHLHLVRKFGGEEATVYRWNMVADVGTRSALLAAVKSVDRQVVWPYPKEVYEWYESAEVHTVQKRLPWQKVFLYAVPVLVLVLLGIGYNAMSKVYSKPAEIAAGGKAPEAAKQPQAHQQSAPSQRQGPKTTEDWVAERKPRIVGLPHTAPMYDQVTQPVAAPYPAACVASATRCLCYTQQGTRMSTPDDLCRTIADTGYFVNWDTSKGRTDATAQGRESGQARAEPGERSHGVTVASSGAWGGVPARDSWGGVPARN